MRRVRMRGLMWQASRRVLYASLMFGFLKKKSTSVAEMTETIAFQPPGEVFPWIKGMVLTAVDEVVVALPIELLGKDEPIGSIVVAPDDMQIIFQKQGGVFYLHLKSGMSVSLTKSSDAMLVADDKQPRRLKITGVQIRK